MYFSIHIDINIYISRCITKNILKSKRQIIWDGGNTILREPGKFENNIKLVRVNMLSTYL
jgi:hypothetical protein